MKHIQKAWIGGSNTICVTIPKYEREQQNIEAGDFIEVEFNLVEKSKLKKTSKNKKFIIEK